MNHTEQSYWEKELYNRHYDLIVVGAGLTGQSLAHFFKKENPSATVLVIDRGFYPLGASTRNAGFACFGSVTEHMSDMKIEEESRIIERIKRRYEGLQLLRETLGEEHIDYHEPGGYEIFIDQQVYEEALDHLGICNEWLVKATGVSGVYSPAKYNGYSAIKIELEGALHPGKMMNTLYRKNLELGIEFRWQSPVQDVQTEEGTVVLQNKTELEAGSVAVATNSFTPDLLKDSTITPGRGFVFITKPLFNLKWKGTFHYDRGYYYFRNVGQERLLLGGARSIDIEKETTTDFGVNPKIKAHLKEFATEVLQLQEGWEIEQEWSGIMGFTETKSPLIQKVGSKTLLVAGLSGMGVALGMQLGKEGAQRIATL